ncbi:MAG: AAA family ATPase [Planctomycetaceae bacterium]|nr:AAA family ATPase [Planctomycetaceae bacterium]
MTLTERFKAARRAAVPIVGVTTPDPAATVIELCAACKKSDIKVQWDFVRGFQGIGDESRTVAAEMGEAQNDPYTAYQSIAKMPAKAVCFFHLAHKFISDPPFLQSLVNLRDTLKADGRTLILMGPALDLAAELQHDVVILDEPLPGEEQLAKIVATQLKTFADQADIELAKICTDEIVGKAVEAVRGLSAFAAEQVVCMSLTKKGLDIDALWERKRQQIEQTPGLKVYRGGDKFDAIGGVAVVKSFVSRVMQGAGRPNAVVFVDEIEKSLGGAKGDLSGVGQDQLGCLLSYMQDHGAAGMIFVGPPGAAKSAIAKAAGNEGGVPTIQLDLGAAKGSLVGQSEQQLRQALKVITAVSNGKSLWIATCNSIGELPPELRRRFTLGTFFFDLPDKDERYAIWSLWLSRYGLLHKSTCDFDTGEDLPHDEGWTGAEIRQCCDIAWRLRCTLKEAGNFIVPVARSASDAIERLRAQADGRFLSASHPGVFKRVQQTTAPVGRAMEVE